MPGGHDLAIPARLWLGADNYRCNDYAARAVPFSASSLRANSQRK